MRKIKSLVLAVIGLLCSLSVSAEDFEVDGIYYNITSSTDMTVEVTYRGSTGYAYSEYSGAVSIPETVTPYNGRTYSVTSIGRDAFQGCSDLTSIEIPNSVTTIGTYAFTHCTGLTSLEIGNSVTSIGDEVFYGCSGLTSLEIGNSVTSIGNGAFNGCPSLTSVNIEDVAAWCNIDFGGLSANPLWYAKNLYLNGEKVTELVIPNSVTSIGNYAFSGCSGLTSVEIPNSVTSIGNYAFAACSGLTSVVIPNNVTSIGNDAFFHCTGLTSVVIGNSVTSIGNRAFSECSSLTSVEIGNSVTSIGDRAFNYCNNLKCVINCSELNIIKGSRDYGGVAFYANLIVNNYDGRIGGFIFAKENDTYSLQGYVGNETDLVLPANYKDCNYVIAPSAFYYHTVLTSVEIGNSVTSIGEGAFYGCSGLTSVEIPNSVTSIGEGAFYGCSGLTSVNIEDVAAWCNIEFNGYTDNPLYYAKNLYLNGEKVTELVIPNGVTSIGSYAFYNCSDLTSVEISNSVTSIGDYAFYKCSGLTSVEIPNSVTSIGDDAFFYCSGLTSVKIPNCVTSIGDEAFYGCSGLTSVNIEDVAAWCNISFGSYAANPLSYADSLYLNGEKVTELVIPDSVTSIGDYAFFHCTGLTSVVIGNSVTSIGNCAFSECSSLTSVVIPNNVTSIGSSAFSYCSGLTSLVIGNSVTNIGGRAFSDCKNLKLVFNSSDLNFEKGSYDYGYVAYYADAVINKYDGRIGDFIFTNVGGTYLLQAYLGNATEVVLPANYKESNYAIAAGVFEGHTEITSVEIPNSVTSIGDKAFYGCENLKTVLNRSNLPFYKGSSYDGYVAYYANMIVNKYAGSVGDFIFTQEEGVYNLYKYLGNDRELLLPENYKDSTYVIGASVFSGKSRLTSVVIPNSVTSIGERAFYNCTGLTSVEIPNSVTSIGTYAFSGCTRLTSVEIGSSVTSIGTYAFSGCTGLTSVNIEDVAAWCKIEFGIYYQSANTVNITSNPLFYAKNLYLNGEKVTDLVIPDSVTKIGEAAFLCCAHLTSVEIPNSVTNIGNWAFYECSGLTSLVIPNGVTNIGDEAFYNCSGLTSVEMGNSLTCIGNWAFYGCSGLTSVVIPNSVTSIGASAFSNCENLKMVLNSSNLTFTKGSEEHGCVAYYADLVVNKYDGRIGDFIFVKDNETYNLQTYIGNEADLVLPENYKDSNYAIGVSAFRGCSGLTSVVMGNSVTSIGEHAFRDCSGLTSVELGNSLKSIGYATFAYCSGLTSIKIPDSVTSIDDGAFYECSGLTTVKISNSVTTIPYASFKGCTSLTSVTIPNNVTSVGESAFQGCENLETLYISSEIASIGDYAFFDCAKLINIQMASIRAIVASENIFSEAAYNNACLYVPNGRKFAYEKTTPWNRFFITEMDFTGINDVITDAKTPKVYYDLNGRIVTNPTKGIYILNGKKVWVK